MYLISCDNHTLPDVRQMTHTFFYFRNKVKLALDPMGS